MCNVNLFEMYLPYCFRLNCVMNIAKQHPLLWVPETLSDNWTWPFQEKKSIRPSFSAERIFGGVLLAMCTNDFICFYDWAECRLIRRIDVNVKVT